jgi:hypothetical protein
MNTARTGYSSYIQDHGGRVLLLFLLFLLALYQFYAMGITGMALVCVAPILILMIIAVFQFKMLVFWMLCVVNFFIQSKFVPIPIPISLPNEMLEIVLLILALIEIEELKAERLGTIMLYVLLIWCGFCILEILNDTCGLGININAWYTGARMMGFQLLYVYLVFVLYITNPPRLIKYLYIWGTLSLFAVFWIWKQQNIGLTDYEHSWLYGRGYLTHILNGGTLIRYFSTYSDAANCGVGMASTAIAFLVFGIASKVRKHRIFFLIVGLANTWGMFPTGTRTAIVCFFAGIAAYVVLSKSVKIAIPITTVFIIVVYIIGFTNIGSGNAQIRRMRTAFDKEDKSANVRTLNQQTMKKYMVNAPWGIGLGMGMENVPANNKYRRMATIPPDSEYVFIWLRTGKVGITLFLICTAIIFIGACWIVLFRIKNEALRGIGAGMCCAFVSVQLGGYGNQVLMQFPNCLIFYGGMSLVYALPFIEPEWVEYEKKLLEEEKERKRLKLEKKQASRI